jgi:signal transduction histidine kinase/CheY-like chemotaxis protein
MCENRNLRKDGGVVHCQWYNSPLRDENDTIVTMFSQVADITDLKNAMDALCVEKERAEAASLTKTNFLANMSHEIRTPLNGILGMLQLIRTTELSSEQSDYIAAAIESSRRLTELLADILDISRVEAGKLAITPVPFNLVAMVDNVCGMFLPAFREKGVAFDWHVGQGIADSLVGDTLRVRQILSNLLGNAAKFTDTGEVILEACPLPTGVPSSQRILFTVSDTGIGIDDDQLDSIFESFSQADSGYQRHHQGAGLGLAITRRLIALMGGNIAVDSRVGEGTTFHFCLVFPVHEEGVPREADAAGQPRTRTAPLEPKRILLAEDVPLNSLAVRRLLEKRGHAVTCVSDGRQAVNALRDGEFDLVLMDVQMPVMDGVKATRAIRDGEAGADKAGIPVIALTAHAMDGDEQWLLDAGMDAYAAKPIDIDTLLSILDAVLNG